MKPSITTSAFYALVEDPETADVILGDLTELRAERAAEHGLRAARRWYWRELCRSILTLLLRRLREAPARVILSAMLGVLTIWAVQIPFSLASNGLSPAGTYLAVFIAGRLVAGIAAGVLVAGINRAAALAAAAWVIPCWILCTLAAIILSAASAAVIPASAPASVEINALAAVPDLVAFAGVIIGALLIVTRSPHATSLPITLMPARTRGTRRLGWTRGPVGYCVRPARGSTTALVSREGRRTARLLPHLAGFHAVTTFLAGSKPRCARPALRLRVSSLRCGPLRLRAHSTTPRA